MTSRSFVLPSLRDVVSAVALLGVSFGATACQNPQDPPDLSSLRRSGQVSFLCIGPEKEGVPLDRCPQGSRLDDGGITVARPGYELHALLTQTVSAEVAVVRVTGRDSDGDFNGKVLDVDPSNPGVTPLRVGQKPVDIVTTPGGTASFVGVGEVGRPGIFSLPTSCIFEPGSKANGEPETQRDLTTWAACSLPATPGEMILLVDPADDAGLVRTECGGAYVTPSVEPPPSALRDECAVDLNAETVSPGRRKLLVSLPDLGKLVVLDAQEILNREPGSFDECKIEAELPLEVNLPSRIVQPLPDDLIEVGCTEPTVEYGPYSGTFTARPAGMDARDDVLVIGDQGSPAIHVVDTRDPCALVELEPLVATSFEEPKRVVTTSRVSLSPKTPDGKQYVYAIDEVGNKVASIMAFDVTPGATSRTPLVRPGSSEMPLEPPDRIEFTAPAKDVTFALFDQPIVDPVTGTAAFGTRCDPDPRIDSGSPPALYRPSEDGTDGARPRLWRGLFAYVLLGNGQVAVVDIDDFDAACRRPVQANSESLSDFRGCRNDPAFPPFYTSTGEEGDLALVTNEVTCRAVVPHRARSSSLLITDETDGTNAPSLRSFGRLSRNGRGLALSRATPEGRKKPILLGVDFAQPAGNGSIPAQVYVGNVLRRRGAAVDPLVVNPRDAEQSSLVLPFIEPRAYPANEIVSITYEGDLDGLHRTGMPVFPAADGEPFVIEDQQATFCDSGVQSRELTREVAEERFGLTSGAIDRFGERHSDYLQITSELLDEEDSYWEEDGQACLDGLLDELDPSVIDRNADAFGSCDSLFGDGDAEDLVPARDFEIRRAYQGRLEVFPRRARGSQADAIVRLIQCCFPDPLLYRVRAGNQWVVRGESTGFRHSVRAVPVVENGRTEYLCARDCSPLKRGQDGRAFELSSTSCENTNPETSRCGVGPRTEDDVICAYDSERGEVSATGTGSECIFADLNRRFAVYRGLEPTQRGMTFGFEVTGGFASQTVALTEQNSNVVLPVSIVSVPTFGQLGIVDSQNRGLMMLDLRTAQVAAKFF